MIDAMDRASKYVVVLTGDGNVCLVADGWDRMIRTIKGQIWNGDDEPDWWPGFLGDIEDDDNWSHGDFGRFAFRDEIGEIRLTAYRVTGS